MRNNFNLFEVLDVSAGKIAFQKLLLFSVTLMLLTISFSSVARPEYVVGLTQQGIRIASVEEVELGFNYELEKISKDKDYALKIKVFSSDVELNNMLQARIIKGYFGSPMMFIENMRDFGPCISPFNAFQLLIGIETLSLRARQHAQNAMAVAEYLNAHPEFKNVLYPGLKNHPYHPLALKYLKNGFGGVLSFELNDRKERAIRFIESLELISHLANVGDVRTLIIIPSATTHEQLSEDEQRKAGISPTLIRLSVGIEHVDDIINDIEQALKKSK